MDLEDLYRENYHIVYGYVLSLCSNASLAEDITSETFLRAIRQINRYDGTCRPSTWLCAIAKNLYIDEFRRRKKLHSLDELPDYAIPDSFHPEQYVIDKETATRIRELVVQLKQENRHVFLMRLHGLSFHDIGLALGQSETWARVTYFRTKNKILEQLSEDN